MKLKTFSQRVWFVAYILAVVIPFGLMATYVYAVYPFDMGGRVLTVNPVCVYPPGVQVNIIYPPSIFTPLFYIPGLSSIKMYGVPYAAGQLMLGNTYGVLPCLVPGPYGIPFPCTYSAPTCTPWGYLVAPNAGTSATPAGGA